MKLFPFIFLLQNPEALKYKQVLQAYKESTAETGLDLRKKSKKKKPSGNSGEFWEECPALRVTGNIETYYCEDNKCVAICRANSQPFGNNMLTCVKGRKKRDAASWIGDQPQCVTCGVSADSGPPLMDENIDSTCTVTKKSKNMKICSLKVLFFASI
jgi:hypothetical protein